MTFNVIKGPAAIAMGKQWIGIASGNRWCEHLRGTPEEALSDARVLEQAYNEKEETSIEISKRSVVESILLASDDFDIPNLLFRAAHLLLKNPAFFVTDIALHADEFGSHLVIYGQQHTRAPAPSGWPEDATWD